MKIWCELRPPELLGWEKWKVATSAAASCLVGCQRREEAGCEAEYDWRQTQAVGSSSGQGQFLITSS